MSQAGTWSGRYLLQRGRRFDPRRLIALLGERRENLLAVGAVAGLDGDVEPRALGRHVEKQAAMIDLEDVGTKLAEPRRDLAEDARPVRNGQPVGDDAPLALELAH